MSDVQIIKASELPRKKRDSFGAEKVYPWDTVGVGEGFRFREGITRASAYCQACRTRPDGKRFRAYRGVDGAMYCVREA